MDTRRINAHKSVQQLPPRFDGHLVEMWAVRHVLLGKKGTQMIPELQTEPLNHATEQLSFKCSQLEVGKVSVLHQKNRCYLFPVLPLYPYSGDL